MSRILIIDDDAALGRSLQIQLQSEGHEVSTRHTAADGLEALESIQPELVLLDLNLPDMSGLDVLTRCQEFQHQLPVVVITARQEMSLAISAMRNGAFDYLRKPFDLDDVLVILEKAARSSPADCGKVLAGQLEESRDALEIIGADRQIMELIKQIGLLSRSRVNLLIEGESGTGKELVARALHMGTSPEKPFVAVNCSAVVSTLFESELFGHEKGSFTGAQERKIGKMEYAGEGTLFLDEIGDMPLDLQAKLLRVLQQREFERVGGLERDPLPGPGGGRHQPESGGADPAESVSGGLVLPAIRHPAHHSATPGSAQRHPASHQPSSGTDQP